MSLRNGHLAKIAFNPSKYLLLVISRIMNGIQRVMFYYVGNIT
jgi:hypothetical protein